MLKTICVICICLVTFPLCGQELPKYQVATITDVKMIHPDSGSDVVSYDVSVKVGGTIYVVLYTPPLGMNNTVQYAAGRELLVAVGKKTITYNDILGQSMEVAIVSQRPAEDRQKQVKSSSNPSAR